MTENTIKKQTKSHGPQGIWNFAFSYIKILGAEEYSSLLFGLQKQPESICTVFHNTSTSSKQQYLFVCMSINLVHPSAIAELKYDKDLFLLMEIRLIFIQKTTSQGLSTIK